MKELNNFILEKLKINKDSKIKASEQDFKEALIQYIKNLKSNGGISVLDLDIIFDEKELPINSIFNHKIKTMFIRNNRLLGWVDGDNRILLYDDLTQEQKIKIYDYITTH